MNKQNSKKLLKALKYAINIIEMYEADTKNLKDYIDKNYSIDGFCQGTIYRSAIKDIKKIAGIK